MALASLTTRESPEIARYCGDANRGAAPSTIPATPAMPATVVVFPKGVILRIVAFRVSVTYTLPAPSTTTPLG